MTYTATDNVGQTIQYSEAQVIDYKGKPEMVVTALALLQVIN